MQKAFLLLILFKLALHVSGYRFAPPQEHFFLTVYTAFGTMHRQYFRPVLHCGTGRKYCRCIVPKAVYTVKKLLLRMGEFVIRNM